MQFYKIEELAEMLGKSTRTIYRRLKEIYDNEYNDGDIVQQGSKMLYSDTIYQTLKNSWDMYDDEEDPEVAGEKEEEERLEYILSVIPKINDGIFSTMETISNTSQIAGIETEEILSLMNLQSQMSTNYCSSIKIKYEILKKLDK